MNADDRAFDVVSTFMTRYVNLIQFKRWPKTALVECVAEAIKLAEQEGYERAREQAAKLSESEVNFAYVGRNPCRAVAKRIRSMKPTDEGDVR